MLGQRRDGELRLIYEDREAQPQGLRTGEEASSYVFDYIERFYNPVRKHSKPDFLSPVDFEHGLMG